MTWILCNQFKICVPDDEFVEYESEEESESGELEEMPSDFELEEEDEDIEDVGPTTSQLTKKPTPKRRRVEIEYEYEGSPREPQKVKNKK